MRAPDSKTARRSRCVSQYPSELTQALRSFLMPTSDSSPAMMPSSQLGLVGTGGFTGIVADNKARPGLSERRFLPSVSFAACRGALAVTIVDCPTFQKTVRVTVLAV